MPIINGKERTPEQAIADGRCPETGIDLAEVNIEDHINRLWPRDRNPDALKRIDLLRQFDAERKAPPAFDDDRSVTRRKV